ncbi:TPA: hypothetical protein RG686_003794 [Morganella morganii]|jgi:membrane protein involved in colicin uptake|nr:hypothetical protein [Morganella morganii]
MIRIVALVLLLTGCAHDRDKNYDVQHNVSASTTNEYVKQIRDYMRGALVGFENGKQCNIVLQYGSSGLLESTMAQEGDPDFCSHILKYMIDPLHPIPNAPLELRNKPIYLNFKL